MTHSPDPASAKRPRPLSPHLQIYRLPLAALTSIAHRLTGVALTGGAFVLAYWLYTAANNPTCFNGMNAFFGANLFGVIMLSGWVFSAYYHLCAGIRHLIWDAGFGFEKTTVTFTSFLVIGAALLMTACTLAMTCPYFKGMMG